MPTGWLREANEAAQVNIFCLYEMLYYRRHFYYFHSVNTALSNNVTSLFSQSVKMKGLKGEDIESKKWVLEVRENKVRPRSFTEGQSKFPFTLKKKC